MFRIIQSELDRVSTWVYVVVLLPCSLIISARIFHWVNLLQPWLAWKRWKTGFRNSSVFSCSLRRMPLACRPLGFPSTRHLLKEKACLPPCLSAVCGWACVLCKHCLMSEDNYHRKWTVCTVWHWAEKGNTMYMLASLHIFECIFPFHLWM